MLELIGVMNPSVPNREAAGSEITLATPGKKLQQNILPEMEAPVLI
jgi:hypothetical protein